MVREISGVYIEVEAREPDRPDLPDRDFDRQSVRNADLVDAFCRFASARSGSFERLLKIWVSNRLKAGLPVNLEEPEIRVVTTSLKKALQAGFERARRKRK